MKCWLCNIILICFILAGITLSSRAQTADETLKWLNDNKRYLQKGNGEIKYIFNFTDEALEYLGEEFHGKLSSKGVIKYRWSDITGLHAGLAHVTIVLFVKGKGTFIDDDGMQQIDHGSDFTLMDYYQNVKGEEFLKKLKLYAVLKGAKLDP